LKFTARDCRSVVVRSLGCLWVAYAVAANAKAAREFLTNMAVEIY
jgi:hypothetical protein